MKKLLLMISFILTVCILTCSFTVFTHADSATSGTYGDISWEFNTSTGELNVFGNGKINDLYQYSTEAWNAYKEEIRTVTVSEGITEIGENAFYGCFDLMSVTRPESLLYIGESAFAKCRELRSITIPGNVISIDKESFSSCYELMSITLNDGLQIIDDSAFNGCSKLTSINIPDSVIAIGEDAFQGCSSLRSIKLPNGITSISDSTFYGCTKLTTVDIPNSVTEIGELSFYLCESLTNVTIPYTVTSIGRAAFAGCKRALKLENGVNYLGRWVIGSEDLTKNIVLREDTVGIADDTFNYNNIKSIKLPCGVKYIGASALPTYISAQTYHTYTTCNSVNSSNHQFVCRCGHSQIEAHEWDTGKVTVPPTQASEGERLYTCIECKSTLTEAIAKLAPDLSSDGNGQNAQDEDTEVTAKDTDTDKQADNSGNTENDTIDIVPEFISYNGCGSVIGSSTAVVFALSVGAVLLRKKKEK